MEDIQNRHPGRNLDDTMPPMAFNALEMTVHLVCTGLVFVLIVLSVWLTIARVVM